MSCILESRRFGHVAFLLPDETLVYNLHAFLTKMADVKGGESSERSKGLFQRKICVREELKLAVTVALDRFRNDENAKELEFPSSLTAKERAFVHRYCFDVGLTTKSRGKANKRFLTVYKKEQKCDTFSCDLKITKESFSSISHFLNEYPVTSRDKHELINQLRVRKAASAEHSKTLAKENRHVLSSSPHVPPKPKETDLSREASTLPIYKKKHEILTAISNNKVVLIAGDTGSGKTTQVGQYILEECRENEAACRIMCTQPRRLSAISVSERVAAERGERVGQTIGYQIRLESKVSAKTSLLYCTNGVLLRLLMLGHKALANLSHVIVDEIHERDRFSDFLLIALRDLLKTYKNLKVVLMSAALNIQLFQDYFGSCPVIHVPGQCHDVKVHFLEDVLKITGYLSSGMRKVLQAPRADAAGASSAGGACASKAARDVLAMLQPSDQSRVNPSVGSEEPKRALVVDAALKANVAGQAQANEGMEDLSSLETRHGTADGQIKNNDSADDKGGTVEAGDTGDGVIDLGSAGVDELERIVEDKLSLSEVASTGDESVIELDDALRAEMDACIAQAWLTGDEEAYDQMMYLFHNENIHVDYAHSDTHMTALMVAAARGHVALLEQLIELGACVEKKDPMSGRDALGWATYFKQDHVVEFLEGVISQQKTSEVAAEAEEQVDERPTEADSERLDAYHRSFDDEKVDVDLIFAVVRFICRSESGQTGAILVFLPGYEDIVAVRDRLVDDEDFADAAKFQILMLHSTLAPDSQRRVFARPPPGARKIVLSTNIAETSVTIDDVVYVVDTGKVKEKSHDALSSVSCLRSVWISKASAIQRKGRAGRCAPGVCFHLYSRHRFRHFKMYQDAEILRVPIHELCLQTKMLAPVNVSIADYLSKAPEPPAHLTVRNSIQLLKVISALDENEDLTDLGKLLCELPIDPQLGKMVLFGLTLKCLEPVAVIAACLSYKEPFYLPSLGTKKAQATAAKEKFSAESYSDHVAMLRAFQAWQVSRRENRERAFCLRNFVSSGTMEMIAGTRSQLISVLRIMGLVKASGPGDLRDLNTNSQNWAVVKAAVAAGLYPKFVRLDRARGLLMTDRERRVAIHTSSVLGQGKEARSVRVKKMTSSLPFDWLAYEEMSRLYCSVQIRSVTLISSLAVALVAGPALWHEGVNLQVSSLRDGARGADVDRSKVFVDESDSEQEDAMDSRVERGSLKIDDWIAFHADDAVLAEVSMLRVKLLALFAKRVQSPGRQWSNADDSLVQCVASVLSLEEENAGFKVVGPVKGAEKSSPRRLYESRVGSDERKRNRDGKQVNRDEHDRSRVRRDDYSDRRGDERRRENGRRRHEPSRGRRSRASDFQGKNSGQDARRDDADPGDVEREREPYESDPRAAERSRKGPERDGDREERTPKHRPARYFILKCNNARNLEISCERGIWATTKGNQRRLEQAFRNSDSVFLIFSIQSSGHFQGVAKMVSHISEKQCPEFGSNNLGGVFEVQWLHREDIQFQFTQHLQNPWNDNKKVQVSRDAQELEPSVGEALCRLWDQFPNSGSNQGLAADPAAPRGSSSDEFPDPEGYYPEVVYEEAGHPPFVPDGFPIYNQPFSPHFLPQEFASSTDFQHMPPPPFPPPPAMPYAPHQQYPVYPQALAASQGFHRQQEFFPLTPQYAPPRRPADVSSRLHMPHPPPLPHVAVSDLTSGNYVS